MYVCSLHECNTVREPTCLRGGEVTASSVTGTGPGAVCPRETEEPTTVTTNPKQKCKITIRSSNKSFLRHGSSGIKLQVC